MTPEQLLAELRTTSAELLIIESAINDRTISELVHAAQIKLHTAIRRAEFLATAHTRAIPPTTP